MVDRLGLVGKTIDGRYRIDAMIGEGAMGAVYRAEHSRLGRTVAIKFLHREYAKDPEALQRFFTEARAVASLGHTNIVDSIDMGELPDGEPYLVLEFLDGRQLSDAIQHAGRLSVRRSLRIARQIAAGLDVVHEHDIIHRDLKSENVFLTVNDGATDHVKILDFGVARILSSRTSATKPGHLVGTPEFMPPEQISDPDHIDTRADVYATGAIIYHMLSGQKPYAGTTQIATLLHKILREPPAPLPDDVPPEVQQLVRDCMARDRDQRIPTMKELISRIDRIAVPNVQTPFPLAAQVPAMASAPPAAPATTPANMMAPAPRTRLPLVIGAAVVVIGIGLGAMLLLNKKDQQAAAHPGPESGQPPVVAAGSSVVMPTTPATPETPPPVADTTPPPATATPATATATATTTPATPTPTPTPATATTSSKTATPTTTKTPAEHTVAKTTSFAKTTTPPAGATSSKTSSDNTKKTEADKARLEAEQKAAVEAEKARIEAERAAAAKAQADAAAAKAAADAAAKAKTQAATPAKTGIDVAAVRASVKPKLGAIMSCFERARMDDPNLNGTVTVRITEAADGAVTAASIASTTLGSVSAERCIVAEVGRWRLAPPLGGVPATFDYPFVFR